MLNQGIKKALNNRATFQLLVSLNFALQRYGEFLRCTNFFGDFFWGWNMFYGIKRYIFAGKALIMDAIANSERYLKARFTYQLTLR
jgi:hypothetical protein